MNVRRAQLGVAHFECVRHRQVLTVTLRGAWGLVAQLKTFALRRPRWVVNKTSTIKRDDDRLGVTVFLQKTGGVRRMYKFRAKRR
jgi:hypothetical protein